MVRPLDQLVETSVHPVTETAIQLAAVAVRNPPVVLVELLMVPLVRLCKVVMAALLVAPADLRH
jgi:hypothetical protein